MIETRPQARDPFRLAGFQIPDFAVGHETTIAIVSANKEQAAIGQQRGGMTSAGRASLNVDWCERFGSEIESLRCRERATVDADASCDQNRPCRQNCRRMPRACFL
jgi:hypothetical protein